MVRNFTDEYKAQLIQMIRQNEAEKWCDATDYIGDRLLDFADLIHGLDLYRSFAGANAYMKLILDKNNTTIETIERIFREVRAEDAQMAGRVKNRMLPSISEYSRLLVQLTQIMDPKNGQFTVQQMQQMIREAGALKQRLKVIGYDTEFTRDIYDLVYDENGKRIPVDQVPQQYKDQVIQAYEDAHPEWTRDMEKILGTGKPNTLTADDIRNIKYIAYTADEPYRSIYLENVSEYRIGSVGPDVEGAYYSPSADAIYLEDDNDEHLSRDPRGPYTTFFHESGHASDANQGSWGRYYTETCKVYSDSLGREVTLQEALEHDVYQNIEDQVRQYVTDDASVDEIVDAFRYGGSSEDLEAWERSVYNQVVSDYDDNLRGETNEAASDVYGGVTNLKIDAGYGHRPEDGNVSAYHYWYNSSGHATGAQSKELWAEYFSYCMTGDEEALESLRRYFPEASKVLDQMAVQMGANAG